MESASNSAQGESIRQRAIFEKLEALSREQLFRSVEAPILSRVADIYELTGRASHPVLEMIETRVLEILKDRPLTNALALTGTVRD